MHFWDENKAKGLFQKLLSFFNTFIEKPFIKHLKNIDLLHELPFYGKLSIVKISKAFKRYARSYKIETIDSKDPFVQLAASKSSIKDLFEGLLHEIKGFKYQTTVKVLLSKHNENRDIEFAFVYFNFTTKTVINSDKYMLDKSFQEILYRVDNWINEGSCQVFESINGEYMSISIYSPLSGSTYIELPYRLRNLMKGLINIKHNEINVFFEAISDISIH